MNHVLEADGIQLEFDERRILSGIYLKCETSKITGLLGRNGQGKSCLMNCIYGTLSCEKSVRFDRVSMKEAYKRPDLIRYLPQFHFIPTSFSLYRIFKDFDLDYHSFVSRFPEFTDREKDTIEKLSGGERRLIEIYLIVRSRSQFAMLDEPFTALNPLQIEKVKLLFLEEKENKGLLITDHIYKHVLDIADDTYILKNGRTYLTKDITDIEILGYARI
jgi:ABC-type lipopolysaccharide export system ATPase subunit